MPMAPGPQTRLMEGIAHGWKPTGMKKPPSKAVAKEFVAAGTKKPSVKHIAKALSR